MRNGTQSVRRMVALASAIAALAAPAAWAAPAEQYLGESTDVPSAVDVPTPAENFEDDSYSSLNSISPYTPASSPGPAVASAPSDGFDWGDAGIGATTMLAFAAMVAGSVLILRTRPQRGSVA